MSEILGYETSTSSTPAIYLSEVDTGTKNLAGASMLCHAKESCEIIFNNLSYSVPVKTGKGKDRKATTKHILNNVSGIFRSGRMTAIMGASGAGKTSLLNILSGDYSSNGVVTGEITVNGELANGKKMRKMSGFVCQDDVILPTMNVEEAIKMSALLRLPESISEPDKLQRVKDIIQLLHLDKAANTLIGSTMIKGISGGERKRTSIAMEMVTNPSILFLDEPTSGLDTFTAYRVMECLSELSRQGRTVVATIHQPSSEVFYLFDDLLILCEGEILYFGEVAKVVEYFAKLSYQCPTYNNPSDYIFMKILKDHDENFKNGILSIEEGLNETATERLKKLKLAYKNSEEAKSIASYIRSVHVTKQKAHSFSKKHKSGFIHQSKCLIGRAWKNVIRNKMSCQVKIVQSIFIGLLVGLIYRDVSNRPFRSQIMDREGALYFVTVNMFMSSTMAVLAIFFPERAVFIREFGAGYYSLPSYFFSKLLVEVPFFLMFPIVTTLISYFLVGFQATVSKFLICCIVNTLTAAGGFSLGIFISCIFPEFNSAMASTPLIILPLMIFSGLFVNSGSIPVYFDWIKYISPMKYAFSSLIQNEFSDLTLTNCVFGNNVTYPTCSGTIAINELNMDEDFEIGLNILMLVVFIILYLILSYGALWRLVHKKR